MSDEPKTTVAVYVSDLAYLKRKQRQMSATKDEWLLLPDVIRAMVTAASITEQDGIVMVPMIENPALFNQRTEEIRAQGDTETADKRDKFSGKQWRGGE